MTYVVCLPLPCLSEVWHSRTRHPGFLAFYVRVAGFYEKFAVLHCTRVQYRSCREKLEAGKHCEMQYSSSTRCRTTKLEGRIVAVMLGVLYSKNRGGTYVKLFLSIPSTLRCVCLSISQLYKERGFLLEVLCMPAISRYSCVRATPALFDLQHSTVSCPSRIIVRENHLGYLPGFKIHTGTKYR